MTTAVSRPAWARIDWTGVLVAIVVAGLLWRVGLFVHDLLLAVRWPFELDYGEGIVWEQAERMVAGRAYGDIARDPIVFHYPPIYHLLTMALAGLLGADVLATGRLVSVLSLLSVLAGVVWLVARVDRPEERGGALWCGGAAALFATVFPPVLLWTGLMRVDLLALAFSTAGVMLGVEAFRRPRRIHVAQLFFVAAVFTKQTAVAAPAALTLLLLLHDRRTAVVGVLSALAIGGAVLLALTVATDGGVLRHMFLYNVNRFSAVRLRSFFLSTLGATLPLVGAVAMATRERVRAHTAHGWRAGMVGGLASSQEAVVLRLMLAWVTTATVLSATAGKSGSNVNYFLEPIVPLLVLLGLALRRWRELSRRPVLALLALATVVLAPLPFHVAQVAAGPSEAALWQRVAAVRALPGPVVSDDMVLLKRAGRPVLLEPAIAAELASTGAWDERPLVRALEQRHIAAVLTMDEGGPALFNQRYSPAVRRTLLNGYTAGERWGSLIVRRPAAPAGAAAAR